MNREKLSGAAIEEALQSIPKWSVADGKLRREYKFRDFTDAFSFMTGAALLAAQLDHHPEWSNVYGTVRIELWTHSAGGLTPMDFTLARGFEELAGRVL